MNRRKRKARKKYTILIIIISLLGIICYFFVFDKNLFNKNSNEDYTIKARDSALLKEEFNILKQNYYSKDIDYESYAKSISKLFIIDLYTIDNKDNKYDVTSSQYVHPDIRSNFKLNVGDTLYKYLEEKSSRKNKYPEVKSIKILEFKEDKFTYDKKEYDSYTVSLMWEYKKDLGYDKKGVLNIIKEDKKLYVVKYQAEA